jgi:hypothetical protein
MMFSYNGKTNFKKVIRLIKKIMLHKFVSPLIFILIFLKRVIICRSLNSEHFTYSPLKGKIPTIRLTKKEDEK